METSRGPARLQATFEALVVDWDSPNVIDAATTPAVEERLGSLAAAGTAVFVLSAGPSDGALERLRASRNAGAGVHVCGPAEPGAEVEGGHEPWEKAHGARTAAQWLAGRGVTGALILVVGGAFETVQGDRRASTALMVDELARAAFVSLAPEPGAVPAPVVHLGGGPGRFVDLMDEQLASRAARRVPLVDPDPAWVIPLSTASSHQRVAEALATLGNGAAAVRGAREEDGTGSQPMFLVNGLYTADGELLHGPVWTDLEVRQRPGPHAEHRWLDLRTGVLLRQATDGTALRTLRFVSAAMPHAMAMRAEGAPEAIGPGDPLGLSVSHPAREPIGESGVPMVHVGSGEAAVTLAVHDRVEETGGRRVIERLAAWSATSDGSGGETAAREHLAEACRRGFDHLAADHRAAWARQWADAEVVIEGDPRAELAARFAVFHLLAAAPQVGEAAVGARGLTGDGYHGHVFWDAEVFVLPALAAIRPAAARAMLEYRIHRLPAARALARERGQDGARFPWESAGDGSDVTPRFVRGRHQQIIPILTGTHEEHIVADVAWAADHYTRWTGDDAFLDGPGRGLIVETARYWAGRIRVDEAGRGHIYGAEGPDEYHPVVDDNAYTNVMARWNLRRGADLLPPSAPGQREARRWRELADALVDGWNPSRQLYEQFAGYFDLEPLLVAEVAGAPPVAADVVLGPDRVARSQIMKQVDALMLNHLVPHEVAPRSLGPGLAFYEPRTAHGSSLSPAVSASLLARAGQPEQALSLFRLAAVIDLEDVTRTTASGLHLATMGGVWQALAWGFLGLRAEGDILCVSPCLPAAWTSVGLRFIFRGRSVKVTARHHDVSVECSAALLLNIGGEQQRRCEPPGVTVALEGARS